MLAARMPGPLLAAIEAMGASGARFVHDQLERQSWEVRVADAVNGHGLAPLACKTDESKWALVQPAAMECAVCRGRARPPCRWWRLLSP
jgi:hypothetical protein